MNRRTYLRVAPMAVAAGVAGCQGLDVGDSGDETGDGEETEDGGDGVPAPAAWREWIPASMVVEANGEALTVDFQRMSDELPESAREEFSRGDLATTFGVDASAIERMAFVESRPDTSEGAITGTFSKTEVLDHLGASEAQTEEYGGYTVIDSGLAVGDSAIVFAEDYETFIDTKNGDEEYLGETDEEWNELLGEIQGDTIAGASKGMVGDEDDLSVTPSKSGLGINAAEDSGAEISMYLYYEDEDEAQEAEDSGQEELEESTTDGSEMNLSRFERQGNRIVVEGTAPDFEF